MLAGREYILLLLDAFLIKKSNVSNNVHGFGDPILNIFVLLYWLAKIHAEAKSSP